MAKTVWKDLTDAQRIELYRRKYINGENVVDLADALNMNPMTLERYLRAVKAEVEDASDIELPSRTKDVPGDSIAFYEALKRGPWTLKQLSEKFDRSESSIMASIEALEAQGFVFDTISEERVVTTNRKKPMVDTRGFEPMLEDTDEIIFAVASDGHAGSTHAQPSAKNHFIQTAYHKYGVRHIFDPGDKTTGVAGYRGQEFDLVPDIRPYGRNSFADTVLGEVWLADAYTPKLPGLTYYILGGNHDYWGVTKASIDPIYRLANMRDDVVYLGYDVADIPLTDNLDVRLWHPRGGGGTNVFGKIQKGVDRLIRDEFYNALTAVRNPRSKIIIAGHLHIEAKFQQDGVVGIHPGCFEGQTNLLRQIGLKPSIGGAIIKVIVDKAGFMRGIEYTFLPYDEIENDWENWPVPPKPDDDYMGGSTTIREPVFSLKGRIK